jgi:hypothetical protein
MSRSSNGETVLQIVESTKANKHRKSVNSGRRVEKQPSIISPRARRLPKFYFRIRKRDDHVELGEMMGQI